MFEKLEELLKEYNWTTAQFGGASKKKNWRNGSYSHNVGLTRQIFVKGRPIAPSRFMKKDRRIYDECKRIFHDFEFNGVQINKNLLCPPHKDTKNIGNSLLIGLGNYTGGETLIDGVKHDIYYTPTIFNGYEKEHSVCPFDGERYSVVLFKI
jgi:hypothetical protein